MPKTFLLIIFIFCASQLNAQQAPAGNGTTTGAPVTPAPAKTYLTEDQVVGAPLPKFLLVTMPKPVAITAANVHQPAATAATGPTKRITNEDVDYKGYLFTMIFNPTCAHCEDMIELLEQNQQLFHKTKVLLFGAKEVRGNMELITRGYHTDNFPHLVVGTDSLDFIKKMFLYNGLPQINVYDKKRKLVKTFSSDLTIDSLKPYIQ